MPIFTLLLYLTTITILGLLYYRSKINRKVILGVLLTTILVYTLHIIFNDILWQLYSLYLALFMVVPLVYCTLLQRRPIKPKLRIVLVVTSTVFVFLSLALSYVFPVYDLPEPTGSYPIGTSSSVLTITDRDHIENNGSTTNREIKLQFWYPAETIEGYDNVPWLEDGLVVSRGLARDTGLPGFSLDHTITIESNSYKDAPISTAKPTYPVIIISHGWRGFRNLHTDFAEDLASQGYIVVSIDHTHGSVGVDLNGNAQYVNYELLPYRDQTDHFLDFANTLVTMYKEDIIDTLDFLEAEYDENASRDYIAKMDLTHIGHIGHSTGGGAGVAASLEDPRIDAVFGLDAWVEPIGTSTLETGLTVPSFFVRSGQWEIGYNNEYLYTLINNSSPSSLYQIDGTTHYDFTMVYMYSPLTRAIGFTGDLEGRYLNDIQRSLLSEFFNETLVTDSYNGLDTSSWEEMREISTE